MTITKFHQVKATGRRKENGKWKQKTFTQTVNPWNKNEDGTIKSFREVDIAVHKEAQDWSNFNQ